ncbi:MAG: PKD domain-containing protein [Candidatus Caldatribacterium sp.]|nr:PKD domain-containing protein [Candidatus Caldatribacterium sp.]
MRKRRPGLLFLASGYFFLLMAGCSQGLPAPESLCPTATLTVQAPASVIAGREATFKVRVNGALPPGTTFVWDFGDGSENKEGLTVSHTYASGGESGTTYTVTVTAKLPPGYESCTPPSATLEVFVAPHPVYNRTRNTFYDSIQEAINEAENGDVIVVAPGIYREDIDFLGKNLTLQNANLDDPSLVAETIIEGNRSVVIFQNGCNQARLVGFTIQGGSGTPSGGPGTPNFPTFWMGPTFGGGIYIENASPTIEGNWIRGNTASIHGGGIYISGSSFPRIIGNRIEDNQAANGGGIYVGEGSFPVIYGNIIFRNKATGIGTIPGLGGGIFVQRNGGVRDREGNFWSRESCPPAGEALGNTWNYQENTFSENYNADGATKGCHVYFD